MLAHLHHTPRVRPHYPHWARDAVIAAQVGAAALIVVTALEHARHDSEGEAQRATLSRTTVEQVAAAPVTTVTTVIDLRESPTPTTTAGVTLTGAAAPDAVATAAAVASATAVESAAPAAAGVLAAPVVLQGQIDVAVEHDGAATSAFPALTQDLLGPIRVEVLAADDAAVATTVVEVGQIGRIEGLPAGRYHLVLSTESPVSATGDAAVSAANAQLTSEVVLVDGDVLLIAPQQPNA